MRDGGHRNNLLSGWPASLLAAHLHPAFAVRIRATLAGLQKRKEAPHGTLEFRSRLTGLLSPTFSSSAVGVGGFMDDKCEIRGQEYSSFEAEELFGIFRDGLVALVPIVERARIAWYGPHVYDDWDNIAIGLFDGIIESVVYNLVGGPIGRIPRYGQAFLNYADKSFFTDQNSSSPNMFHSFETRVKPFDHVRLVVCDETSTTNINFVDVPVSRTKFALSALDEASKLRSLKTTLSYRP